MEYFLILKFTLKNKEILFSFILREIFVTTVNS